jgi:methylmalonyl-CoA/ethylmalonyl-CoA epimerase
MHYSSPVNLMSSTSRPTLTFDHAGVVVRDLGRGFQSIKALLPITSTTERFDDHHLGVSVQFVRDESGVVLELIAPLGSNSPVAKIAASRIGVINQFAYRVEELSEAGAYFRSNGAIPTAPPKSAIAFGGALVQFFLVPDGFIVELIEAPGFSHQFGRIER